MSRKAVFLLIPLLSLVACAPLLQTMAAISEAQQQTAGNSLVGASAGSKLMLFGGAGHRTYLGCLNCGQYAVDGVENSSSEYGSSYSTTSIFNHYSAYGSKYSMYSACNPYASDPPVIVDASGGFHGRLTLNSYAQGAINNENVRAWLTTICG